MTIRWTATRTFVVVTVLGLVLSTEACKSAPGPAADDATLATAVQSRLTSDSALSTEAIQSSVEKGIVTLTGTVSSEAARSLAASDVSQIAGIKTVVNNLTVGPPVAATAQPAPLPVPAPMPEPAAAPQDEETCSEAGGSPDACSD